MTAVTGSKWEETTGTKDAGGMVSHQGAPVVEGGVDGAYHRVGGSR
jgi:hypothetical protein